MNHTKGPWKLTEIPQGKRGSAGMFMFQSPGGTLLFTLPHGTFEQEANARLVAAAPDLLDALRKLANEASGFLAKSDIERHGLTNNRVLRLRIEEARDALARAEGRMP